MNALLYILFCVAEVGHDRELEKDLFKQGYSPEDNKQRKRWKSLMTLMFAIAVSLVSADPLLAFLWCVWAFWFVHELGLAIARGNIGSFGRFGTTADTDVLINKLGIGAWVMRLAMTLPFIVLTYLMGRL